MIIAELNKMANSLHHNVNEFDKRARAEARAAIKAQDQARWEKITSDRRRAGEAANETLDLLEDQAMSTAAQKEIAAVLNDSTAKARDLLNKMKKAAETLKTVAEFADLVVGVLGTVKKIVTGT